MEIKPTGIEGLNLVSGDGPVGPFHRRLKAVIERVFNVAAHVELECGHTVVVFNPAEFERRGGLVYCGECAEVGK